MSVPWEAVVDAVTCVSLHSSFGHWPFLQYPDLFALSVLNR